MNPLQELITGTSVGLVYGSVGIGFVVIHRITGVVNFAQGDMAVAGAFGAVVAAEAVPPEVSLLAAAAVGGFVGALVYYLAVHPLRHHGLLVQTIVTLGAALVLRSATQLLFGTGPHSLAAFTGEDAYRIAGASFQPQVLWVAGIAVGAFVLLATFFDRTMMGRAMTACAVNRYAAGIVGIKPARMAACAFVISGAFVGVIAAAQVPIGFVAAGGGLALSLKGFIAAVLGGFDRVGLALVGGVLVGLLESFAARTSYQEIVVLVALLILIVLRPSGLSRMRVSERV